MARRRDGQGQTTRPPLSYRGPRIERREAFALVRQLVKPLRLRVEADDEGYPRVPGRYGQIEFHDDEHLAVLVSAHPRVYHRLLKIAGVRTHQTGDEERRLLFPPSALPGVAGARPGAPTSPRE